MQLHARTQGNGPPVVLLHGLFGSNENLSLLARALAGEHAVHALDLRNHGRSPHADAMDYPAIAGDVRDTMAALGLDSAALVGHSLGGKVAMELALSAPDAVARLVVLDIAPVDYPRGHDAELEAMRSLDLSAIRSRREADEAMAAHLANPAIRQFLLKNLVRDESGFSWRIPLGTIAAQYPHLAAAPTAAGPYPGPALFIRGAHSGRVTAQAEAAIGERFPHACVETIAGAGHWVHVEAPEATAARIRAFLAAGRANP